MKSRSDLLITIGTFACFLACIGDFTVTFTLGALYDGYHFIDQSESFLGTSDSPLAIHMTIWGVLFCLLLVLFAIAIRKALPGQTKWTAWVFWMIIIYALGEGLGSGIVRSDSIGGEFTFYGKLHNVLGGIGITALAFLPLVVTRIFTKDFTPRFYLFSVIVFFVGIFFVFLFLLSKTMLIPYRGLWQRTYLLNYHTFLLVLAVVTKRLFQHQEGR